MLAHDNAMHALADMAACQAPLHAAQNEIKRKVNMLTHAFAPITAARHDMAIALAEVFAPVIAAQNELSKAANMLTRAHLFLVEQYEKSPKAKAKRAHAALVAICQRKPRALQLSLREVAAMLREVLTIDTRPARHALLSRAHLANAPNWARSQIFDSYQQTRVAATN